METIQVPNKYGIHEQRIEKRFQETKRELEKKSNAMLQCPYYGNEETCRMCVLTKCLVNE
jgi:hypothetical protein